MMKHVEYESGKKHKKIGFELGFSKQKFFQNQLNKEIKRIRKIKKLFLYWFAVNEATSSPPYQCDFAFSTRT